MKPVTAQKTLFSFYKSSEKILFPKMLHWNITFLVLSGKVIFLFPKNMILIFIRKRKGHLSQKNPSKYDVFFKCFEKMVFPKKSHKNMILFVICGNIIFLFSGKYEKYTFFNTENERWSFSWIHGNMIFYVHMCKCYKYDTTLLPK